MTGRILTALTAISFALLVFASPHSAQERRQSGQRNPVGDRSQESRRLMDMSEAEKLRNDLITAFTESEELVRYLAGFDFIRQSKAMEDYETVLQDLSKERSRIEQMTPSDVLTQVNVLPDPESVNRVIELSRQVKNDAKLREVILTAQRYSQAGFQARGSAAKGLNSRGVIAAPSYIPPVCNHDDPSNYPSGTDIAISNGVAIALHTLADVLPDILGFLVSVPNFVKIALVIAAGAVDQVTNALEAVASDAEYCEGIRLYIEDKLANETALTAILITDDYYFSFTLKTVRAAITKATSDGIPINCGNTRLMEAAAYFDGSDNFIGSSGTDRVIAYRKLRAAFQNIGAASCVQ